MTDRQRRKCSVCGRPYLLTKDGNLGHHLNGIRSSTDPRKGQRCEGAGKLPAEVQTQH